MAWRRKPGCIALPLVMTMLAVVATAAASAQSTPASHSRFHRVLERPDQVNCPEGIGLNSMSRVNIVLAATSIFSACAHVPA
ncbi:MAG: hypothetical protein ACREJC_09435 [Tepidisphaeraceae bacterium]